MNKYLITVTILLFFRKLILFSVIFFATRILPLQLDFLGGGITNYQSNPYFWTWANFDGVHYLSIAQDGYKSLQYFFFPLYPILMDWGVHCINWGNSLLQNYVWSGLLISHLAFVSATIGIFKLVTVDYDQKLAIVVTLLLLVFPTSFYFDSVYTESLFLALSVWSLYFMTQKKWLLAGVMGGFASATRLVGIALLPALLIEISNSKNFKEKLFTKFIASLGITAGLISYLYFLNSKTGDPLAFLHNVEIYGPQRSSHFVVLPQVFYRYIVKIMPAINYHYFPIVFVTLLEFVTALGFGSLVVVSILGFAARFKKLKNFRLSFVVYGLLLYVIPTLSGSFSSLPRYMIVNVPLFIVFGIIVKNLPIMSRAIIFSLLFIGFVIATGLFIRGYWIS